MMYKNIIGMVFASLLVFSTGAAAETIAVTGGKVHTLGKAGTLEKATVLIKDGVIKAVGMDISVPADAQVIDASGMVVAPGFMHANNYLGLSEITKTTDSNEHSSVGSPFGASYSVVYGLSYLSPVVTENRRHGLTHAISNPTKADDVLLGSGAVISLNGTPDMVVMRGPLVADLHAGGNRNVAWAKLHLMFDQAEAYRKKPGKIPADSLLKAHDMAALWPVLTGKQIFQLAVDSENDIRLAIAFKQKYGIKMVLAGATEAWKVAAELVVADIPVVIDPFENLPSSFGALSTTSRNAALLYAAGVRFAIAPGGSTSLHNAHHVAEAAGVAVRYGLPWEAAIKAITVTPAQIFGLQKYGTLETGMVATLTVWDGDPLQVTSNPQHIVIAGKDMPLVSRQSLLRDKYLKPAATE